MEVVGLSGGSPQEVKCESRWPSWEIQRGGSTLAQGRRVTWRVQAWLGPQWSPVRKGFDCGPQMHLWPHLRETVLGDVMVYRPEVRRKQVTRGGSFLGPSSIPTSRWLIDLWMPTCTLLNVVPGTPCPSSLTPCYYSSPLTTATPAAQPLPGSCPSPVLPGVTRFSISDPFLPHRAT